MHSAIEDIFEAKIAKRGGIVRRSTHTLEEQGCLQQLISAARDRGWSVYEIEDQMVIVCTPNPTIRQVV